MVVKSDVFALIPESIILRVSERAALGILTADSAVEYRMPKEPNLLEINVADETKIKEQLIRKFKDPARRKKDRLSSTQTVGDDYFRDTGTWNKRNMIVDRDNDKFFHEIIDGTGKVIKRVEGSLKENQGHGSAKHKRKRKPKSTH